MTDAERVLRLLGNASAFQADIASACDLSIREVQAALQELRLAGHPIVTSGRGVRLAAWAIDVEMCAASLRSRAFTQFVTARALKRTARRMRAEEDAAARLTLWGSGPGFARFTAADTLATVEAKMARAFAPLRAMQAALADLDR